MDVVAHEDDDILFIDPATSTDVAAGRCLTTVYLTAGDDGQGASYWHGREDGAMAAYAEMAGRRNSWTTATLETASGQAAVTRTLDGGNVRLIFLRLPTGSPGGRAVHDHECLSRLRAGAIAQVHAVDGTASYTSASLRATLTGFMTTFRPSVVRTLDYVDRYGDGDHADHHNAAYYSYEAQRSYTTPHRLQGFRGYPITRLPANQPDAVAARKLAIFLAYSAHDSHVCQTAVACHRDREYWPWMLRAYQVTGPPAPAVSTGR
jgi:LmbE family N-acetylglucosaminyl deacetylase